MKIIKIISAGFVSIGIMLLGGYLVADYKGSGRAQDEKVMAFIRGSHLDIETRIMKLAETEIERNHFDGVVSTTIHDTNARKELLRGIDVNTVRVVSKAGMLQRMEFILGRKRILVFAPTGDFGRGEHLRMQGNHWALFER